MKLRNLSCQLILGHYTYKDCTGGLGFFNTLFLKSIN